MPPRSSRNLPYAKVTSPEDPPLRPERHVPNSIATMRRSLVAALATMLSRCPCCAARNRYRTTTPMTDNALKQRAAHKLSADWKPIHEFLPRLKGSVANHPQK